MCGIAAIFAYDRAAPPVDTGEVVAIRDAMIARGPDGAGCWRDEEGRVGLGHRRLSIIDLSAGGTQPMASRDGRLVVTFNGEIYNYRALRAKLEAEGAIFASNCDTEVLLHLYQRRGENMLDDLRGMFAFAIWDAPKRRLFMARDPYGIKPLYYADDGHTVRVASQVKALVAGGRISPELDPAGLVGFYLWGSVPEPFTTLHAVRALPAGCHIGVDARGLDGPHRYHSIASVYASAEKRVGVGGAAVSVAAAREAVRGALLDSVRHHLVADVPVGAFLSAGVDSGALIGLMRDAGQSDLQTITLSFEEFRGAHDDEAPLARQVAGLYGARHTERIVSESEFRADLPLIMAAMDQPSVDGINTWFTSKAASELGLKVAISGLGGDELFGGYPSFRDVPRLVSMMRVPAAVPGFGAALRRALVALGLNRSALNPKIAGVAELGNTYAGAYLLRRAIFLPWELDQLLDPETVRKGLNALSPLSAINSCLGPQSSSAFAKVATLESSLYMRNQLLRDADWASMAHSLEIRVPLVDATLLSTLAPLTLASGLEMGKAALAAAPRTPLPDAIVRRRKTGFTTPVSTWLQQTWPPREKRRVPPGLLTPSCPWARKWAFCVAPYAA